jgi:hypothetical protein
MWWVGIEEIVSQCEQRASHFCETMDIVKKRERMTGITDAQALAIGHLTITFNFMEAMLDSFISIILASPNPGIAELLIEPLNFSRKLDTLKKLVDALSEHYVPSDASQRAYQAFASSTKALIVEARALNDFRNEMIHWRADHLNQKVSIGKTPREIDVQSARMNDVGVKLASRWLGLYDGTGAMTFGQQFRKTGKTSSLRAGSA